MIDSTTAHEISRQWSMHGIHGTHNDRGYGDMTFSEYSISLGYTRSEAFLMLSIICKEAIDDFRKIFNQHTHQITSHLTSHPHPL